MTTTVTRTEALVPSPVPQRRRSALLEVADVALVVSLGLALVAGAYAVGRMQPGESPTALAVYWVGEALMIVPVAARLLRKSAHRSGEVLGLLLVLGVAEYVAKVAYSPISFTFSDEQQHWRTLTDILNNGQLFDPSYALPISPYYPGLESATAAVVQLTGLPIFPSGVLVVGAAHLATIVALYLLFERAGGSPRTAGAAVLLYATNSHFTVFDSMFLYGAMALAYLVLALLALTRAADAAHAPERRRWLVVGVLAVALTVISHHITSFALLGILLLFAATALVMRRRRELAISAFLTLLTLVFLVAWIRWVAPATIDYLGPGVTKGLEVNFDAFFAEGTELATSDPRGAAHRLLAMFGVVGMAVLLPIGWWVVVRSRPKRVWAVALTVGSVLWFPVVAWRFSHAGPEYYGRVSTFVYLLAGYTAGLGLLKMADFLTVRFRIMRKLGAGTGLATAWAVLLFLNGVGNGWPPYWEALPGGFQPGGHERSVTPRGIAVADWALAALGPGNRIAADRTNYVLLGTYGDQDPIRNGSRLYMAPTIRDRDLELLRASDIDYVLTDLRLTRRLPINGQYFADDPGSASGTKYLEPLPEAAMRKYDDLPGVSRIYDGGAIKVYDVRSLRE